MNSFRSISSFTLALVFYVCLVPSLHAQTSTTLDKKVVDANRELDQRLMDAHALKDAALVESLFSESPDVFFFVPPGALPEGLVIFRHGWAPWLTTREPSPADFRKVSTSPAGEGV